MKSLSVAVQMKASERLFFLKNSADYYFYYMRLRLAIRVAKKYTLA